MHVLKCFTIDKQSYNHLPKETNISKHL